MCFNPHRSRDPGATEARVRTILAGGVSILTGAETPVQLLLLCSFCTRYLVSILTGAETPVQRGAGGGDSVKVKVSILTGAETPVQP